MIKVDENKILESHHHILQMSAQVKITLFTMHIPTIQNTTSGNNEISASLHATR